jgi:hypothetical protein
MYIGKQQFATISGNFLAWEFNVADEKGGTLALIDRNFQVLVGLPRKAEQVCFNLFEFVSFLCVFRQSWGGFGKRTLQPIKTRIASVAWTLPQSPSAVPAEIAISH